MPVTSGSPSFTATVSAITDAFGDPTRRSIYLFARERSAAGGDGGTAAIVAAGGGGAPHRARPPLVTLAAGGDIEVGPSHGAGGGAGRPAQRTVAGTDVKLSDVDFPVRSDDLLLSLLGRALDRLPADEAEQIAEEVGEEYGRARAAGLTGNALQAGQRSLRSALQSVADALTAHGFAAHADNRNDQLRIINNHCPFGDVATEHPVICAVDRGMVRGMLGELYDADALGELGSVTTESSLAAGDTFCTTAV
jgi:predicted ArsR family transcriptional regulator